MTTAAALTDRIMATHHSRLKREIPQLRAAFRSSPVKLRATWEAFADLMESHLEKEENILFPALAAQETDSGQLVGGLGGPIQQLRHEHAQLEVLVEKLQLLAPEAGEFEDQLVALMEDTLLHVGTEENELFVPALAEPVPEPEEEAEPAGRSAVHPAVAVCRRAASQHRSMLSTVAELDAGFIADGLSPRLMAPWTHFIVGLREHFADEEEQVFAVITGLAEGRAPATEDWASPLHDLQFELDEIRTIADALRHAAPEAGAREQQLYGLLDLLEAHAAVEEGQLFPMAMDLLAAWAQGETGVEEPPPAAAPSWVLRPTQGNCNVCLQSVPAQVVRDEHEVRLEKHCGEHGTTVQLLSRSPDYWAELDSFYFKVNAEDFPQRDYIVRMTERCNLDCPICLAKANTEDTPDLDLSGLEELLSERRGIKVDLMAAEPTLREDLEHWVRRVKATGNIAALHTNGLKLADLAYAQRMKEAGVDEVFLQFDGFDDDANEVLRGARLLKTRLKALRNLREVGISTSLIVVVARGVNEEQVARTFRFALEPGNDHIKEVFFLGLRLLGSARDSLVKAGKLRGKGEDEASIAELAMMPDEIIEVLCEQEPKLQREDIRRFNKLYFALLSAFKVKKCLYVQHYLVTRDGLGGMRPISELIDLPGLDKAAERYGDTFTRHPALAKARLLADLARCGVNRQTSRMLADLVRLQLLFRTGMNLKDVPRRFLLLGFITACDPNNFDAAVAINCGKGELSSDGGFIDSGAVANVRREARFASSDRTPGARKVEERRARRLARQDKVT